jgi:ubiquitin-like modifier-activating enzyme ATG7
LRSSTSKYENPLMFLLIADRIGTFTFGAENFEFRRDEFSAVEVGKLVHYKSLNELQSVVLAADDEDCDEEAAIVLHVFPDLKTFTFYFYIYFNVVTVGWDVDINADRKMRKANLGAILSPEQLVEASRLNLHLMQWNLFPNFLLDRLLSQRVLILGAGTLGCMIARTLVGYGIQNITFIDNSLVSFNNPTRQHLFTMEDAVKQVHKALAAAKALKQIQPGCNYQGIVLDIPMVGASSSGNSSTVETLTILSELISTSDVVFNTLDSRAARWLPTLLCQIHDVVMIVGAIGFSSYLILKVDPKQGAHQISMEERVSQEEVKTADSHDLNDTSADYNGANGHHESAFKDSGVGWGCYFCTDISAPSKSSKPLPLDQQCTVSRPGVANLCASLSVEVYVNALHRTQDLRGEEGEERDNHLSHQSTVPSQRLVVPHQIRGDIDDFSQYCPYVQQYTNCVACGERVLKEYILRGHNFILDVCRPAGEVYLNEVAGVNDLLKDVEQLVLVDDDEEKE